MAQKLNISGLLLIIAAAFLTLPACTQQEDLAVAPYGDVLVLEQLANSYRLMANDLPTTPSRLNPKQRKKFISAILAKNGYGYSKTLHSLAQATANQATKDFVDLAQLLLMPHTRATLKADMEALYSEQERNDIIAIEALLKNSSSIAP